MLIPHSARRAPLAIALLLDAAEPAQADAGEQAPHVAVRNAVAVPLRDGLQATCISFTGLEAEGDHFALLFGSPSPSRAPLVRLHSECVTGDVFGSLRCDLILLAIQGRRAFGEFLFCSQTKELLAGSGMALLFVPKSSLRPHHFTCLLGWLRRKARSALPARTTEWATLRVTLA
jgi:hypothetical protein